MEVWGCIVCMLEHFCLLESCKLGRQQLHLRGMRCTTLRIVTTTTIHPQLYNRCHRRGKGASTCRSSGVGIATLYAYRASGLEVCTCTHKAGAQALWVHVSLSIHGSVGCSMNARLWVTMAWRPSCGAGYSRGFSSTDQRPNGQYVWTASWFLVWLASAPMGWQSCLARHDYPDLLFLHIKDTVRWAVACRFPPSRALCLKCSARQARCTSCRERVPYAAAIGSSS